jgi:hypothetical protein
MAWPNKLNILGQYMNVGKTYMHTQSNFQFPITDSFLRSSTTVIPCQINTTEQHNFHLNPFMFSQKFVSLQTILPAEFKLPMT